MENISQEWNDSLADLQGIAMYLCDDNQKEAQELLERTRELALKYESTGDLKKWFRTIMKFLWMDKIKLQVRT